LAGSTGSADRSRRAIAARGRRWATRIQAQPPIGAIAPLGEVTRVNPENRSFTTVGKIVTLGEVVADAYEEQTPSEWSYSSKPARAATMRRSSVAISPRRA
jgi:hypothetical protein